jgi:hypothetical protein
MNSPRALSARRRLISATDKHRFTQKEYFRRLARTKLLLGLLINLGPPKLNLNASSSESVSIRVNLWLGLLPLPGKRLKFIGSVVEREGSGKLGHYRSSGRPNFNPRVSGTFSERSIQKPLVFCATGIKGLYFIYAHSMHDLFVDSVTRPYHFVVGGARFLA